MGLLQVWNKGYTLNKIETSVILKCDCLRRSGEFHDGYLTRFNERSRFESDLDMAWKGYDFDTINELDEEG